MATDEVVDVVAVRHSLVAAASAVRVRCVVRSARVGGRARRRVARVHRDRALVDVAVVRVMEMTVVQVVRVVPVLDRRVTARLTVLGSSFDRSRLAPSLQQLLK